MSALRRRLLLALAFLNLLIVYGAHYDPRGQAHIWFMPRAEGMLLLTPDGQGILVDGSADPIRLAEEVAARLPPLWGRLRLAILTRDDDAALATHADLFRRYPPQEAWRPLAARPRAAAATWEDRVRESTRTLEPGLSLAVDGLQIRVVETAPTVLWMQVGRLGIRYAPEARWEESPPETTRALVWVVGGLPGKTSRVPLPPIVILPPLSGSRFAALSTTILRHPHTLFLIGQDGIIHITTDGTHYRLDVQP